MKNLELFKSRLKTGIKAVLWEGDKHVKLDTLIKLSGNILLEFTISYRMFSFVARVQVSPVRIDEIFECTHGTVVEIT